MKFLTLFFNAMRLSGTIDCRQFAIDPSYPRALERALCADVMTSQPVRAAAAPQTSGGTAWRTA